MKKLFSILTIALIVYSCKDNESAGASAAVINQEEVTGDLPVFGADFKNETILSAYELGEIYSNLKTGDTVKVTFEGPVKEVCQAKGCWMQVDVGAEDPVMVKFKDYGFFVPKDLGGKRVVVHGMAFISEVPVEEQQHYAKDAGKSEAEIAAITLPKKSLGFTASGVKIAE
ncbi:DUF4920 domain-containing protein [Leeuwenhoekiella parthenopeia]|uniref:DUF4920 domain-containing protein n=1 Tax=Leeuwenhoekiella parthenopeia TaxID=2890320 RepID=A0ABS8GWC7_9FLAO|nr:DUF4920 domain-containing protein [Leeuwenhoekiella parthenopeia]MCC4214320.1 DUF4920 domain-containing protein [Leeuwenhoekiella parthenopeia]